jgi:hypothetical protein
MNDWHDIWCGDHPLKDPVSKLFCIARDIDALVANHMFPYNDKLHWGMNFILLVHDWEVEFVPSFFNPQYFVRSRGVKDNCFQVPSKRQSFEVNILQRSLPNVGCSILWKSIWRSKARLRWRSSCGQHR